MAFPRRSKGGEGGPRSNKYIRYTPHPDIRVKQLICKHPKEKEMIDDTGNFYCGVCSKLLKGEK